VEVDIIEENDMMLDVIGYFNVDHKLPKWLQGKGEQFWLINIP
jgi:hypothetical protein